MKQQRRMLINTSISRESGVYTAKQNPATNGFYSKYIYQDLVKIRARKSSTTSHKELNERHSISVLELPATRKFDSEVMHKSGPRHNPTPQKKEPDVRSSLSKYLVRNESLVRDDPKVAAAAKVQQLSYEAIINEKDDQINTLKKLLSKAIKLLGNIQTENMSNIQKFLDTVSNSRICDNTVDDEEGKRYTTTKNKRAENTASYKQKLNKSCIAYNSEKTGKQEEDTQKHKNSGEKMRQDLKSVESALKSFLGGFNSIKAELSTIGETLNSF